MCCFQALDASFAKATPKYEDSKKKKAKESPVKSKNKGKGQPIATTASGRGIKTKMVKSPSTGSSSVGVNPVGHSLKMKDNPAMSKALAQSYPPGYSQGESFQNETSC